MDQFAQNAVNAISLGSLYALSALGIALIFGVMGLINFAHGELIMAGGYAMVLLYAIGWPIMVLGTIATTIVFAIVMERVAFRPLRNASAATLLIASFTLSYLLQSVVTATATATARPVVLPSFISDVVEIGSVRIEVLSILTVGCTALLLIALATFLKRTALGLEMRAAAEDFRMARLLGVRANRVIATAFAISGFLAGFVSLSFVGQTASVTPTMGVSITLVAFVATVVGGMGSIVAAPLGGFLLGVVTVALQVLLPDSLGPYRDAFVFAAVIAVLLARPQGLLVRRTQERIA
jgi:branched-chain amino acid transport system permease protein